MLLNLSKYKDNNILNTKIISDPKAFSIERKRGRVAYNIKQLELEKEDGILLHERIQ